MCRAFQQVPAFRQRVENTDSVPVNPCLPGFICFHRTTFLKARQASPLFPALPDSWPAGQCFSHRFRQGLTPCRSDTKFLGLLDMGLPKPAEPRTLITPFDEPPRTFHPFVGNNIRFSYKKVNHFLRFSYFFSQKKWQPKELPKKLIS